MEGDLYPEEYFQIAEVAGNPEKFIPMNEFQKANLSWWDNEIERLGVEMKKDREEMLLRRKKSDEYQQRTNVEIRNL